MNRLKQSKQFLAIMLIGLFTLFTSCHEDTQDPCCNDGVFISITFPLRIKNNAGEDLLNPNTPGYYNHSDIYLYKITKGVKRALTLENNMIANPEPYADIFDYRLFVRGLGEKIKEVPYPIYECFLQLNSSTVDNIKVETLEKRNYQSLRKIWYNDKLIWEYNGNNNGLTIIK